MKQLLLYKYATWLLLILNISLILFILIGKPAHPPSTKGKNFRSEALEMLQLSAQQQATFIQLAEQHNRQMESIHEQQRVQLRPYFRSLVESNSTINTTAILQEITQLEREKVEITYQHFQEVKGILDEKQLPNFKKFVNQALDILLLEPRGTPPPPKK